MKSLVNIVEGILSSEYDINLLKLNWYRYDNGKPFYDVEEELAKPKANIPFLNVLACAEIKSDLGDTDAHYYSHIHVTGANGNAKNLGGREQPIINALKEVLSALPQTSKPNDNFAHDMWMKAEVRYEWKRKQLVEEWCTVGCNPHGGKYMSLYEHGRLIKTNLKKVDVNIVRPILEQMLEQLSKNIK